MVRKSNLDDRLKDLDRQTQKAIKKSIRSAQTIPKFQEEIRRQSEQLKP